MTTNIYYNFPQITLSLDGVGAPYTAEILLSTNEQPITNIQLNDENYSAYSISIYGQGNAPSHLIVKCYANVKDLASNIIYLAIPLILNANNGADPSVVDNIIDGSGITIDLELNEYIKNEGTAYVQPGTSFPITITLSSDSAIPIKSHADKTFSSNIDRLSINSTEKNAKAKKRDLDWVMSCELLTEDEPEKQKITPGEVATMISFCMMSILIALATYGAGPALYGPLGMAKLAKNMKNNHYTINVYWKIILFTIGAFCLIKGLNRPKKEGAEANIIYVFFSIALFLSFFAGTRGILTIEGIANEEKTDFNDTSKPFDIFSAIFTGQCSTVFGFVVKIVLAIILILGMLGMPAAIALNSDSAFTTQLINVLFFAVLLLNAVSYFNKTSNPTA